MSTAETGKERLEATAHPHNAALTGRSSRSAYVGGWGVHQPKKGGCEGFYFYGVHTHFNRVMIWHRFLTCARGYGTTAGASWRTASASGAVVSISQ